MWPHVVEQAIGEHLDGKPLDPNRGKNPAGGTRAAISN